MTQTIELGEAAIPVAKTNLFKRISVFGYGLLAYSIGCAGLFWLILGMGGLVPIGISSLQTESLAASLATNAFLIILFGIQHSVMARQRFKNWLARFIPAAAERSTYMLMSGFVTLMATFFWQPLPGVVWSVENVVGQIILYTLFTLGCGYLLLATFVTNHFELMGLRQVYLYLIDRPYTKLPFTRKFMYRYSRHPMMLGMLGVIWAVPKMSVTHLVMALLLTAYMVVGVMLEERDLLKAFGDTYRQYKKEIATFIPRVY